MIHKVKALSSLLCASVILTAFPAVTFANDLYGISEDEVKDQAIELDYNGDTLVISNEESGTDVWFTYTPECTGCFQIMFENTSGYDIEHEIEIYDSDFLRFYHFSEIYEAANHDIIGSYLMDLEESSEIYIHLRARADATMEKALDVYFFPSVPLQEERIYVPYGETTELDITLDEYWDLNTYNISYSWRNIYGGLLSCTDPVLETSPVIDAWAYYGQYQFESFPTTLRPIYVGVDNGFSVLRESDQKIFLIQSNSDITLSTRVEGIDTDNVSYFWDTYPFEENYFCSESAATLNSVTSSNTYRCIAHDRFQNWDDIDFDVAVYDGTNAVELALSNPYQYQFRKADFYRIFSFTPETTGIYSFSSEGDDLYASLYSSDLSFIAFNDDIDADLEIFDFSIEHELQAGQTYFLAVSGYNKDEDRSTDVSIKVELLEETGSNTETTDTPTPTQNPSNSTPAPEQGVAGFVERLYTVALGRPSDPAGKQDWIDAVTLRGETGAGCARGFLYSPEFLNKDVSNEEFARVLYRTFFDREPDQAGFEAWVAALNNGASKQEVIEGFINSTEWANLCLRFGIRSGGTGVPNVTVEPNQKTIDFATRLYTTCLGREADEAGLMAWARQLANQRDTGTGAARGFFFSSEFIGQNISNQEYVTRLYRTFMGREPDSAGFDAWVAQLDSGVSSEEVFNGFSQSTEFAGICADYGIIR